MEDKVVEEELNNKNLILPNEDVNDVNTHTMLSPTKEIKYIDDYKNDELVKLFCDQLKINISQL